MQHSTEKTWSLINQQVQTNVHPFLKLLLTATYMLCVMSCVKGYEFSSLRFTISLDYLLLFLLFGSLHVELGSLCFLLGDLHTDSDKLMYIFSNLELCCISIYFALHKNSATVGLTLSTLPLVYRYMYVLLKQGIISINSAIQTLNKISFSLSQQDILAEKSANNVYHQLTCLASTAAVYSFPKLSSVMDTSSRMMWKSWALSVSSLLINILTCWRWVISWEALNLATTDFKTCRLELLEQKIETIIQWFQLCKGD